MEQPLHIESTNNYQFDKLVDTRVNTSDILTWIDLGTAMENLDKYDNISDEDKENIINYVEYNRKSIEKKREKVEEIYQEYKDVTELDVFDSEDI